MSTITRYYNIGQDLTPPYSIDGQNPILLSVNKAQYKTDVKNAPHSHKYLEMFYFISGKGVFECGKTKISLKEGDVLIVDAEVVHSQNSEGKNPLTFYSLLFDSINLLGKDQNCVTKNGFLHKSDGGEFDLLIEQIVNEFDKKEKGWMLSVKGMVYKLLTMICRLEENESLPALNTSVVAQKVKDHIDKNFTENITVSSLADLFFVNKYYLIHTFKKAFNTSPMQYLTTVRLNHAKEKLQSTSLSISEIALACGYDNPAYFAEQFKKTIGTTPSTYRKITSF